MKKEINEIRVSSSFFGGLACDEDLIIVLGFDGVSSGGVIEKEYSDFCEKQSLVSLMEKHLSESDDAVMDISWMGGNGGVIGLPVLRKLGFCEG